MAHAEKCPVCNGKGEIIKNNMTGETTVCHGCNGKGWVEVGTEYPNPINSGPTYSTEKQGMNPIICYPYILIS